MKEDEPMTREEIIARIKGTNAVRTIIDTDKQRIVFVDPTQSAVGRALRAAAATA